MSGEGDDAAAPRRSAVRPPPGDGGHRVEVPRMEPPPPSLEAMVQTNRPDVARKSGRSWRLWLALAVVAVALTAYLLR